MLVYVGECQHWREPCEHNNYGQLKLHYTQKGSVTPENEPVEILDGRSYLGTPSSWLDKQSNLKKWSDYESAF